MQFILLCGTPQDRRRIADVASRMKKRGIKTIVYADAEQKDVYAPLVQEGGRFVSLTGEAEAAATTDVNGLQILKPGTWHLDVKSGSGATLADGVNMGGLYGLRTHHDEKLVVQLGGSKESEEGVAEGLELAGAAPDARRPLDRQRFAREAGGML